METHKQAYNAQLQAMRGELEQARVREATLEQMREEMRAKTKSYEAQLQALRDDLEQVQGSRLLNHYPPLVKEPFRSRRR